MVAYSFQAQFEDPIVAEIKRQTIRAERRRHARPGETLQLYTAMRTKHCRLIGTAICESVWPITISIEDRTIGFGGSFLVTREEADTFARLDGFENWWAMRCFWRAKHGYDMADPWSGVMIRWKDFKR